MDNAGTLSCSSSLIACIGIVNSTNLRFEALNNATIRCTNDPPSSPGTGLVFSDSHNVSFYGITFEGCGSSVIFNASTDISFEKCIFR